MALAFYSYTGIRSSDLIIFLLLRQPDSAAQPMSGYLEKEIIPFSTKEPPWQCSAVAEPSQLSTEEMAYAVEVA